MSLIAMCIYATEENDKLKYVKECLKSLVDTVDLKKHWLVIINNNSYREATDYLYEFIKNNDVAGFHNMKTNLGTAGGINLAIKDRLPNQMVIKTDDDLTWGDSGWVEKLEEVIFSDKNIGICGLKRDDVYGNLDKQGDLWYNDDIFGTCTAYNPKLLDKVGYLVQPSLYGFDDVLVSARSVASGFKNCFRVDIPITNLDEGGTEYTEWKKREAGVYLQEVGILCDMYKSGKLDVYYDGGF